MKKSVYSVLNHAGLITQEFYNTYSKARQMGKIPNDVLELLKAEQKVTIIRNRRELCLEFQKHLEDFWRKHYDKKVWDISLSKDPALKELVGDAYKPLSRADFNVSHEGNRDLDLLGRFLKGIDRKELPMEDNVKWAMMSASSMPSTFVSSFEIYTGRNQEIDIRPFFPDLNFTDEE
jgi:hypothetical protein